VSRAGKATVAGRAGELGRARRHAERAVAELTAALQAWGLWADSVRERAEQRLAVTDMDDQRVLSDPEYGQALDAGGVFAEALRAAEAVLRWRAGLAGHAQVGSPHP
jgi:hypothetical protein